MKINIKDTIKLQDELDAAQKKARERKIHYASVFAEVALTIEKRLTELNVPKKNRKNAEFVFQIGFGGCCPNSYKGRPESTYVRLVRGASDWFVTEIGRDGCRGISNDRVTFVNEENFKRFYRF